MVFHFKFFFSGGRPMECPGQANQKRVCNRRICPTTETSTMTTTTLGPANWSFWGQWSSCSTSCGRGDQFRRRECRKVHYSQPDCPGRGEQKRGCNQNNFCTTTSTTTTTTTCAPAKYSQWEQWSKCSRPCGGGKRYNFSKKPRAVFIVAATCWFDMMLISCYYRSDEYWSVFNSVKY